MGDHIRSSIGAESSGRTAVLLGAGASADAGLLLTSELAAAIVKKANESDGGRYQPAKPDWVRALNAVYAGMVGYKGARGDDPFSVVNIETLISAVRLLRHREDHEVAPFVASWSPSLSNFSSSTLPVREGKAIADAISRELGGRFGGGDTDITKAVAAIARAAVNPDLERPFTQAEEFVLRSLVELLGAHNDVSYLQPLIELARQQPGGVDVITLNYDLTVESAAAHFGVTVNRGIEKWRPGENLDFPEADGVVNLMKLHGSLDWLASKPAPYTQSRMASRRIEIVPSGYFRDKSQGDLPWIVVGDREKLATDGPTLALNFAARLALHRSAHLAIIGYSFGDAHINAMIRDWIAGDPDRTISVLDIQWPRERSFAGDLDFRSALIASYARTRDDSGRPVIPRVLPIEGGASEHLRDAIAIRPSPGPDPSATIRAAATGEGIRFDLTWHGPELAEVLVTASSPQDDANRFGQRPPVHIYDTPPPPSTSRGWAQGLRYDRWNQNATRTFFAPPDAALPFEVHVDAASIAGRQAWTGLVIPSS